MTKHIEVLTATRSSKHRSFTFGRHDPAAECPCTGTLVIDTDRKRERYDVTEIAPAKGYGAGRGFQLAKPDGEVYSVFLADDPRLSTCDCAGFAYQATRKADRRHGQVTDSLGCKHLDCLAAMAWNGWLADPRAGDPDADAGPTETTDVPAEREARGELPPADGGP